MRDLVWGNGARRRRALIMAGVVLAVMPAGCAYRGLTMAPPPPVQQSSQGAVSLFGSGTLTPADPASRAVSYNPALAPIGTAMTGILTASSDGTTTAQFTVAGLLPDRGYAVHVHTKVCGATPETSGPHFQNRIDPAATPQSPSSDPQYANSSNEIWLDLHTDNAGAGSSRVTVPFVITDRVPGSVVVHDGMHTPTDPGHAGKAGTRIACLTLSARR